MPVLYQILSRSAIQFALEEKDIPITNLPLECLYQFEIDHLLEVSLAYEKALLPDFFGSSKGVDDLEYQFAKWRFWSVDTATILREKRRSFLFENELLNNFTIP
jgi:hypothetical protein